MFTDVFNATNHFKSHLKWIFMCGGKNLDMDKVTPDALEIWTDQSVNEQLINQKINPKQFW